MDKNGTMYPLDPSRVDEVLERLARLGEPLFADYAKDIVRGRKSRYACVISIKSSGQPNTWVAEINEEWQLTNPRLMELAGGEMTFGVHEQNAEAVKQLLSENRLREPE